MTCCGQGRTALRASQAIQTPKAPRMPRPVVKPVVYVSGHTATRADTPMLYPGAAPVTLRGAVSGRWYRFTVSRSVQLVDVRDVADLLRKGFSRSGGQWRKP